MTTGSQLLDTTDPTLSDSQRETVDALDSLCEKAITEAYLLACDRDSALPTEAMSILARNGWASLGVAEAHGGSAASAVELSIVHETLGRHSLVVAQAFYSLWVLGAEAIDRLGTQTQKDAWLGRIAAGEALVAFALTEPGSGSDAAALQCRADESPDGFRVTGQKVFITGAAVADVIITAVRTTRGDRKHAGISLLMIDPKSTGMTVRPIRKIGLHALDLCEVFFDGVEVGADQVLGTADGAWSDLTPGLAKERLYLAALSVGAMRDVLELATNHARERSSFGKPIGDHQMIAAKLARMRVAMESTRALVRQAAQLVDRNDPSATTAASMAKLLATESYISATREAAQVFGGYGFTEEYPIGRHYRDAKYLEIGGGTSEIQTIVIARSMGLHV